MQAGRAAVGRGGRSGWRHGAAGGVADVTADEAKTVHLLHVSLGFGRLKPRMHQDLFQSRSVGWPEFQAAQHQVLALGRQASRTTEAHLGADDLFVLLERNVSTHHVVEQDAQRPHGRRPAVVTSLPDPLGWRIHSCTCHTADRASSIFEPTWNPIANSYTFLADDAALSAEIRPKESQQMNRFQVDKVRA